jgi:hypothetical protein
MEDARRFPFGRAGGRYRLRHPRHVAAWRLRTRKGQGHGVHDVPRRSGRPGPPDKEGRKKPYLNGRLTGPDENEVGNVIYLRPSSGLLEVRLPWDEVKGSVTYAQRINSKRSPEVFARVKHQVAIRLVSDATVTEAIKLTKRAMEYATTGR